MIVSEREFVDACRTEECECFICEKPIMAYNSWTLASLNKPNGKHPLLGLRRPTRTQGQFAYKDMYEWAEARDRWMAGSIFHIECADNLEGDLPAFWVHHEWDEVTPDSFPTLWRRLEVIWEKIEGDRIRSARRVTAEAKLMTPLGKMTPLPSGGVTKNVSKNVEK